MKYKKLKKKFSDTASWAVWNEKKPNDTDIIKAEKDTLRSDVVMLSLFPLRQKAAREWGNFHGDKPGQKMMDLFARSSYRGAYITSLYKRTNDGDTPFSAEEEFQTFVKEMGWLGADRKTLFLLFGNDTKDIFFNEFIHRFNNVAVCEHFNSFRLSHQEWIAHNETLLQQHQRKAAVSFKLKPFRRADNTYV